MKYTVVLMALISQIAYGNSQFDSGYQVGRYSFANTEPTRAQRDLLAVIIELRFPTSLRTVGDALNTLLLNSGYRLADLDSSDPLLPVLLNSTLPAVQRKLGPISLRSALTVLAGPTWRLVVDPVHRLVSFDLKDTYKE